MQLYDVLADDAAPLAQPTDVLVRVADATGLGARWPGRVGVIDADGTVRGDLLGGSVDGILSAAVPRPLGSWTGGLVDVELDRDEAERAGLPCGGLASVLVQPFSAIPHEVRADVSARRPTAMLTRLDDPGFATTPLPASGPGRSPEHEPEHLSLARTLLRRGEPSDVIAESREGRVLVSVLAPTPRLVVVGSGALEEALGSQLELLGWSCVGCAAAEDGVAAVRVLGPGDGVLVIDHRGAVDFPILSEALRCEVGYVAALGSRATQEGRRSRLREGGVPEALVARLRGPAGLDIGSRTPAEIALAIAAEMLSVRASASGAALRDRTGSVNGPRS